jgi:DNA invertase Pin-like site-specific DNA recombinase
MKTYDYIIRVSKMGTRHESDESTMTVEDQRQQCRALIRESGGSVGREHKALNQSGSTSVDSKHFREALRRVRRGESHGIAVAYDDRLARDWRKAGRFYGELEEAGAEVLIANLPGVDYRSTNGRLLTGMMAVVSETKYTTAKDRGLKIADATIARGVANRVPFGYGRNGTFIDGKLASKVDPDLDPKALVPDPDTAPLVVRIFEMRVDGHSWTDIGRWLESEGVTPPRGGTWAVSTLRNIIGNEMYLGVVTLGDRRLENAHAPLVSRSLWRAAQSGQTIQRTGRNVAGVAGGLLVCFSCGRRLSVTGSQNPSYTCRRRLGGVCEHPVYVSKRRADAFVEEQILNVLRHRSVAAVPTTGEVDNLRQWVANAKAELEDFVVFAKASVDPELFRRGLDARQDDVNSAQAALDEALDGADAVAELPSPNGWDALDLDRKRQVARALIDCVVVYDATEAAEKAAKLRGVESYPSRGRGADVEMRFDLRGRNGEDWG